MPNDVEGRQSLTHVMEMKKMSDSGATKMSRLNEGPELPVQTQSDEERNALFADTDGDNLDLDSGNGVEDLSTADKPILWTTGDGRSLWVGPRRAFISPRLFVAAGVACALLLGIGIGLTAAHIDVRKAPAVQQSSTDTATDTGFTPASNTIVVDVKGDVRNPGLVTVRSTARVQDVVALAGGFVHEEDSLAVNLAAPVDDGEEIVIPNVTLGSNQPSTSGMVKSDVAAPTTGTVTQAKVDLNTADAKTLETIPGIGPTKASAIVLYRQTHGLFHSVQDLENVKGIGPVTYSKIVPYVVILSSK